MHHKGWKIRKSTKVNYIMVTQLLLTNYSTGNVVGWCNRAQIPGNLSHEGDEHADGEVAPESSRVVVHDFGVAS